MVFSQGIMFLEGFMYFRWDFTQYSLISLLSFFLVSFSVSFSVRLHTSHFLFPSNAISRKS